MEIDEDKFIRYHDWDEFYKGLTFRTFWLSFAVTVLNCVITKDSKNSVWLFCVFGFYLTIMGFLGHFKDSGNNIILVDKKDLQKIHFEDLKNECIKWLKYDKRVEAVILLSKHSDLSYSKAREVVLKWEDELES